MFLQLTGFYDTYNVLPPLCDSGFIGDIAGTWGYNDTYIYTRSMDLVRKYDWGMI